MQLPCSQTPLRLKLNLGRVYILANSLTLSDINVNTKVTLNVNI